jgi:hypothetical protein
MGECRSGRMQLPRASKPHDRSRIRLRAIPARSERDTIPESSEGNHPSSARRSAGKVAWVESALEPGDREGVGVRVRAGVFGG